MELTALDGAPTLGRTLVLVALNVFVKVLDEPIGAFKSSGLLLEDLVGGVARGSCGGAIASLATAW